MQAKLAQFDLSTNNSLQRTFFYGQPIAEQSKHSKKYKVFNLQNLQEKYILEEFTDSKITQELSRKLQTYEKTQKYPELTSCLAYKQNANNSNTGNLLLDYYNGYNLFEFINLKEQHGTKWQCAEISNFIFQMTEQCMILNKKKIIGRSIKPENIMTSIDVHNLSQIDIKYHILDLGSTELDNNNGKPTIKITSCYTAPELFYKTALPPIYNYCKSDIFSIGVIAYIMFFGIENFNQYFIPYYKSFNSNKSNLFLPKNENLMKHQNLANLIRTMLSFNINQRPSFQEIQRVIEESKQEKSQPIENKEIEELNKSLFEIVFPEYTQFMESQALIIKKTISSSLQKYKCGQIKEQEFLLKLNICFQPVEFQEKQFEQRICDIILEDSYRQSICELGQHLLFAIIHKQCTNTYFSAISILSDASIIQNINQEIVISLETIFKQFAGSFAGWIKTLLTKFNSKFPQLPQNICKFLIIQQTQFKQQTILYKTEHNPQNLNKNQQIFQSLSCLISCYYSSLTNKQWQFKQDENLQFLKMFRGLLYLVNSYQLNSFPEISNYFEFINQQSQITDLVLLNKLIENEAFQYLNQVANMDDTCNQMQFNNCEFNQSSPIKS